jgi:hypothetical protein
VLGNVWVPGWAFGGAQDRVLTLARVRLGGGPGLGVWPETRVRLDGGPGLGFGRRRGLG